MRILPIARLRLGSALALLALAAACNNKTEHSSASGEQGGESPELTAGGAGVGGGTLQSAGAGAAAGESSRGEALVQPGDRCRTDDDCDDGLYCNGPERCEEQEDSDFKLCVVSELGPCIPDNCDEANRRCNCAGVEADHDRDGFKAAGCVSGNEKADCDDLHGDRYPTNPEICDPADPTHDEDCDPTSFAGNDGDDDGDKYVSSSCANYLTYQLSRRPGDERRKQGGGDCDDDKKTGANTHPGAEEICDKLDNDCDGQTDELPDGAPLADATPYYRDADGDQWGSDRPEDVLLSLCSSPPGGYVTIHGDCDDTKFYIAPGRAEQCNGYDDDCDGKVDKEDAADTLLLGEPYDSVTQFECLGTEGWKVKDGGCPENRLDCDQKYQNACEVPATTLCNCHACGNTCSFSCGASDCEEVQGGSSGLRHSCFLVATRKGEAGSVACAGWNGFGQLGDGSTKDSPIAVPVPDLAGIAGISAGSGHTCALSADGLIRCWGDNRVGQLGASLVAGDHREPIAVTDFFPGASAKQIVSGDSHTCALYDLEGSTYVGCWGEGGLGQLGSSLAFDGYYEYSPTLVYAAGDDGDVALEGVSQIAAGYHHSCALVGGRVMCWGNNNAWQLGTDPSLLKYSAVAISVSGLENVDEIVAAGGHTCARAGSDVYCWGLNDRRQLATDGASAGPTRIPLPDDVQSIAAGADFACALRPSGEVLCWGSNVNGERGTDNASTLPSLLPLEGIVHLIVGQGGNVCLIRRDRTTHCLGQNNFGQLARGAATSGPQPVPTQVLPLAGAKKCIEQPSGANQ